MWRGYHVKEGAMCWFEIFSSERWFHGNTITHTRISPVRESELNNSVSFRHLARALPQPSSIRDQVIVTLSTRDPDAQVGKHSDTLRAYRTPARDCTLVRISNSSSAGLLGWQPIGQKAK